MSQLEHLLELKTFGSRSTEIQDLKRELLEIFSLFSKQYSERKLVILLDSIDQLISSDYDLQWMIYEFPSNIKIILSTLNLHGGILNRIKMKLRNEDNYLNVEPLNPTNVKMILEDWLNRENRCISIPQWTSLDSIFQRSILHPLFVKLIYDIIIKYYHYYFIL